MHSGKVSVFVVRVDLVVVTFVALINLVLVLWWQVLLWWYVQISGCSDLCCTNVSCAGDVSCCVAGLALVVHSDVVVTFIALMDLVLVVYHVVVAGGMFRSGGGDLCCTDASCAHFCCGSSWSCLVECSDGGGGVL